MVVERGTGWPSPDRDLIGITDKLHWAMPVGFYYKAFHTPRRLFPFYERQMRKVAGHLFGYMGAGKH